MKDAFFTLAEQLFRELRGDERLLLNFAGERSDFVRLNRARVRQAGSVEQRGLELRLIDAGRQAAASLELGGDAADLEAARRLVVRLRDSLAGLPADPWLLINETPHSSERIERGSLATAEAVLDEALAAAQGRDLVGFHAGGTVTRGFANSLGQRNWHSVDSFCFDFSLHARGGQAAKSGIAGSAWRPGELAQRIDAAGRELGRLALPRQAAMPGEYRVFLAPRALEELMGLLCWGGFSARARATRQSPLLALERGERLDPRVTLIEHGSEGMAPGFQSDGFAKPARVALVEAGRLGEPLVSPRSAKEYGLAPNGAGAGEAPQALEMAAGGLADADVIAALDDGLLVSNLWYLNWSDRPAGRATGMTRFATFRVARGRVLGPIESPLRFDDSVLRMLGANLAELTRERDLLPDTSTYGGRSTASMRLPGALLSTLRFTL